MSAAPVLSLWNKFRKYPAGGWVFSKLVGMRIPYTGSVRPRVLELKEGYARTGLKDRRAVRNHLKCIHAIALMNIGEFTTGLALNSRLTSAERAILTNLSIQFTKKARGRITVECQLPEMDFTQPAEYKLEAILRNDGGEEVSRAWATWKVGPKS